MSEIYGCITKHDWENKVTVQHSIPSERVTLFVCRKCKVSFLHYYHVIPNIFQAMKNQNVKEECDE